MDLKFGEFKNTLETGSSPSPIYLFEGEDSYFRERGLNLLKNKYLSEPSLNYAVFDGANGVSGELMSSVTAYPFMSEKRVTALREFYPKKDTDAEFSEFLNNPPSSGILVILNEKPCDFLKKCKTVTFVDCAKSDANTLARWIKSTCLAAEVTISAELAVKVATFCLSDMSRISLETEKLIAYAGKGGVIDESTVELLVPQDAEYKIYEMTDYIAKRNFDKAFSVITEMLGKGDTPQRIILSVYNYFRRLLHAAISGKNAAELAELLGVKEFAASKTIQQSKMFKKRSLKKAVDVLIDSDFKIKSGLIDADEQMWLSVFAIMTDNA